MQQLTGTFSKLRGAKVLVIGDIILDSYTIGKAKRISPEAPVAVLEVLRVEHLAGGAGNVALNLSSLSAEVTLVGRTGEDDAGNRLKKSLNDEGISTIGLFSEKNYQTPVKNRIIADNQQIVRVDHEQISYPLEEFEREIISKLPTLMQDMEVIAISDYGKGFLSQAILSFVIDLANKNNIPVVADPKGVNFEKYRGVTVIKPNLNEAYAAANMTHEAPLKMVAEKLLDITNAKFFIVTRSESGISLFSKGQDQMICQEDFPVRIREVKDVTGAGDTVLAMLSIAIACKLEMSPTLKFCNLAAGIAIERFGCARVSLSDLARRLLEFDFANKVFDEEHLFALQEALKGKKITLLGISGEKGLTSAIFSTIKELAENDHFELIIYIRDKEPIQEFVNILASIQHVKFIILNTDSLRNLCNKIEPDEVYFLEEASLTKLAHVEHLYTN